MRTTIDIPPELLRKAKVAAAERGSTLRSLVIQGLQRALGEAPRQPDAAELPTLPLRGRQPYDLSNEEIESILLNEASDDYGRSR